MSLEAHFCPSMHAWLLLLEHLVLIKALPDSIGGISGRPQQCKPAPTPSVSLDSTSNEGNKGVRKPPSCGGRPSAHERFQNQNLESMRLARFFLVCAHQIRECFHAFWFDHVLRLRESLDESACRHSKCRDPQTRWDDFDIGGPGAGAGCDFSGCHVGFRMGSPAPRGSSTDPDSA